jgi:hypothetical protein
LNLRVVHSTEARSRAKSFSSVPSERVGVIEPIGVDLAIEIGDQNGTSLPKVLMNSLNI